MLGLLRFNVSQTKRKTKPDNASVSKCRKGHKTQQQEQYCMLVSVNYSLGSFLWNRAIKSWNWAQLQPRKTNFDRLALDNLEWVGLLTSLALLNTCLLAAENWLLGVVNNFCASGLRSHAYYLLNCFHSFVRHFILSRFDSILVLREVW